MTVEEPTPDTIETTLKRAVATLRDAGVPFMLGGSLAAWARGGPQTRHDLDFIVPPEHVEAALEALVDAGMRAERPPEEWLVKAWDGDVLIDLIFDPSGLEAGDELMGRADEISVLSVAMPVMALEDVLTTKLLALDEHSLDLSSSLQIARALREQIDWDAVRRATAGSPYAAAFFTLVERLGIAPRAGAGDAEERRRRVRVVGDDPRSGGA